DELGARSTIAYDATYHRFPTSQTNPLNQSATSSWDPVCGAVTQATDPNGNSTTAQYDVLCRAVQTNTPGGGFQITSFHNFGDPNNQYVEVQTPPANGSSNLYARSYFDGLGRTWRTVNKGPAAGQDIYADKTFTARGLELAASAPYYAGASPQWMTTTYDAL